MHYDLLIIGAGQAATPLARACAEAGLSVLIAEEARLGGSCINFGCTPTKAAIASAKLAHQARRAADYGLRIPEVTVDFAAVLERARKLSASMRANLEKALEGSENPRLLYGRARLTGRSDRGFEAEVGSERLTARQVVLDTGTRSMIPPIEGLDEIEVLHAENWLHHEELPQRLAIIGGGYIGLEMAQFYARMGSRVVVIESGGQIAGQEDEDIAQRLQELLEGEGIAFRLNTRLSRLERRGDELRLQLGTDGQEVTASHVFVATGRKPNSKDLGLEDVGVALDEKGFVQVDSRLATSVPGIWAAGDIRGGPMFTHTSWDDNRVLQSQLLGDGKRTTERVEPYAIFTDPQLGRVGLTEREARQAGKTFKLARYELASNGRAKEMGETAGLIKLLADEADGRILGASVLATEGAELVHHYSTLMSSGGTTAIIENAVQIHPTLAEAVQSAVSALKD